MRGRKTSEMNNHDFKSQMITPIVAPVIIRTAMVIYIGGISLFILQTMVNQSAPIPNKSANTTLRNLPKNHFKHYRFGNNQMQIMLGIGQVVSRL